MERIKNFKYVQLSIDIVLGIIGVYFMLQPNMNEFVFKNTTATILFVIIWILLIANFLFLIIDFNNLALIKHDYHTLYRATYSDSNTGIPNRFSCDMIIENYADSILPFSVSCAVIDLTNLVDINAQYDHATGNRVLKDFSSILSDSAHLADCFVGRNGGNKFLAIFEDGEKEKVQLFLDAIQRKVEKYNKKDNNPLIEYEYGVAINSEEHEQQITKLISLANRRIYDNQENK